MGISSVSRDDIESDAHIIRSQYEKQLGTIKKQQKRRAKSMSISSAQKCAKTHVSDIGFWSHIIRILRMI